MARPRGSAALRVLGPPREPGELQFLCDGTDLIEPGVYEAVAGRGRPVFVFKGWKLVIPFEVIVLDASAPDGQRIVTLYRYYNVTRHGQRIWIPPHGDYAREWTLVAGRRMSRQDRPHVAAFEGALCRVEVGTVTTDRAQRPLPQQARYSKVARILGVVAGGVRP